MPQGPHHHLSVCHLSFSTFHDQIFLNEACLSCSPLNTHQQALLSCLHSPATYQLHRVTQHSAASTALWLKPKSPQNYHKIQVNLILLPSFVPPCSGLGSIFIKISLNPYFPIFFVGGTCQLLSLSNSVSGCVSC